MPVIKRIARLTEHRVRTGETLESVARDHNLTVEQLAKFNWNTTDPQQINNRLRTDVGASRRASNSRFFVFDDADDPGIILVPAGFRETGLETDRRHTVRVKKKQVDPNLITCCRIPGITFAYDKSFIRPSVVHFLKRLEHALQQHPDAKIMIFGHTDRCGTELYNKKLSERRARSVYAFITDQPDIWEELYQLERWGDQILRSILADLEVIPGPDSGPSDPDRAEPASSESDMASLVRAYQDTKPELVTDGIAGPKTRRAMFLDYMTGKHDIRVTEDQFLEQKFMGCGEFNPLVEPNEHEQANDSRGEAPGNEENRRVVFYLFRRPPREIPCRLRDLAPCRKEIAKHPGQRTDRSPNPPFACEFYDRIASHCTCEQHTESTATTIRVVPSLLASRGGVLAYAERTNGQKLPETGAISLNGQIVEGVWTAPSGRIYFVPPRDEGESTELSLVDSGQSFTIEDAVVYTLDGLKSVQSLFKQMKVLRLASREASASSKSEGKTAEYLRFQFDFVIFGGHRRLETALNAIERDIDPETDQDGFVQEIETMIPVHGGQLASQQSALFS